MPSFTYNRESVRVSQGVADGNGGDTGLKASDLFYCGRRGLKCRCGACGDVCGPSSGCPCDSCVELVGFKVNALGRLARPGSPTSAHGGDTGVRPSALWYCGRDTGSGCRCGKCSTQCGPSSGCPCDSCIELVSGWKVNKARHLARLGLSGGFGGDTNLTAGKLFYCGQQKRHCRCGQCRGDTCGPGEGCPCEPCLELLNIRVNQLGQLAKPGSATGVAGDLGVPAHQAYYCGQQEVQCRCGQGCMKCGPRSGCPCAVCVELLGHRINSDNVLARLPNPNRSSGYGGDTLMNARAVWYCGRRMNQCRCELCDGVCGPDQGCPCDSCRLLLRLPEPGEDGMLDPYERQVELAAWNDMDEPLSSPALSAATHWSHTLLTDRTPLPRQPMNIPGAHLRRARLRHALLQHASTSTLPGAMARAQQDPGMPNPHHRSTRQGGAQALASAARAAAPAHRARGTAAAHLPGVHAASDLDDEATVLDVWFSPSSAYGLGHVWYPAGQAQAERGGWQQGGRLQGRPDDIGSAGTTHVQLVEQIQIEGTDRRWGGASSGRADAWNTRADAWHDMGHASHVAEDAAAGAVAAAGAAGRLARSRPGGEEEVNSGLDVQQLQHVASRRRLSRMRESTSSDKASWPGTSGAGARQLHGTGRNGYHSPGSDLLDQDDAEPGAAAAAVAWEQRNGVSASNSIHAQQHADRRNAAEASGSTLLTPRPGHAALPHALSSSGQLSLSQHSLLSGHLAEASRQHRSAGGSPVGTPAPALLSGYPIAGSHQHVLPGQRSQGRAVPPRPARSGSLAASRVGWPDGQHSMHQEQTHALLDVLLLAGSSPRARGRRCLRTWAEAEELTEADITPQQQQWQQQQQQQQWRQQQDTADWAQGSSTAASPGSESRYTTGSHYGSTPMFDASLSTDMVSGPLGMAVVAEGQGQGASGLAAAAGAAGASSSGGAYQRPGRPRSVSMDGGVGGGNAGTSSTRHSHSRQQRWQHHDWNAQQEQGQQLERWHSGSAAAAPAAHNWQMQLQQGNTPARTPALSMSRTVAPQASNPALSPLLAEASGAWHPPSYPPLPPGTQPEPAPANSAAAAAAPPPRSPHHPGSAASSHTLTLLSSSTTPLRPTTPSANLPTRPPALLTPHDDAASSSSSAALSLTFSTGYRGTAAAAAAAAGGTAAAGAAGGSSGAAAWGSSNGSRSSGAAASSSSRAAWPPAVTGRGTRLPVPPSLLAREVRALKLGSWSSKTCVVCMDRPRCVALVPCGHYSYCYECAVVLDSCAVCRAGIQQALRVYH